MRVTVTVQVSDTTNTPDGSTRSTWNTPVNSSPLGDSVTVARTLPVAARVPSGAPTRVKKVIAYVRGPVFVHRPNPGVSVGNGKESEVVLTTPPSLLKVPRPTNAGRSVG